MIWALLGIVLLLFLAAISLVLLVGIALLLFVGIMLLLRLISVVKELGKELPQPSPAIPDRIAGSELARFLRTRLVGTPADGSTYTGGSPTSVVWVDSGDEVLVHLDSTTTQVVGQCVLVSIDLETDQTGRTPLVVAFALGTDNNAGLVAATDEFPRGNGMLTARWGAAVQAAVWSAMLSLASDHASERQLSPRGLAVIDSQIHLIAGQILKIA